MLKPTENKHSCCGMEIHTRLAGQMTESKSVETGSGDNTPLCMTKSQHLLAVDTKCGEIRAMFRQQCTKVRSNQGLNPENQKLLHF